MSLHKIAGSSDPLLLTYNEEGTLMNTDYTMSGSMNFYQGGPGQSEKKS